MPIPKSSGEYSIVKPEDVYMSLRGITFKTEFSKKLNTNLCIPDPSDAKSICIQYMKDWFLSGFYEIIQGVKPNLEGYFNSIYIDAKHVFDDFRSLTKAELIKRNNPALTIVARIDDGGNDNENLDLYNYGANMYNNRCSYRDSFFRDFCHQSFISMNFKTLFMTFAFRVRVDTMREAEQLQEYMKIRYRARGTQSKFVDIDFQVPKQLACIIAKDAGFELTTVRDEYEVRDKIGFMNYLNSNSYLPWMYKLRTGSNNYQYYIKLPSMRVHITTGEVSKSDGETIGHIKNNFIVEFESRVRFPAPQFYAYYSLVKRSHIEAINRDGSYSLYSFSNFCDIPKCNSKGWRQYLTTDYIEDEVLETPTIIQFDSLLGDLRDIIDVTKATALSPSVFIEFKLFNCSKDTEIEVNWDQYSISSIKPLKSRRSILVMYVDLKYLNEKLLMMHGEGKDRVQPYVTARSIRDE